MIRFHADNRRDRTCGTILIVAMWIVLVLAGLVLIFARAMRVEAAASANHVAALQAGAVAQGALQFALFEIDGSDGAYTPVTGASFEAVQVGEGFFWMLNPDADEDTSYTYGLRDESSRLNLNLATPEMLLKLPGMTAELAASIVDWRDPDSEVTTAGAESEYYLMLPKPYYCKNAPFESVEELLLVKGATAQMLFGEDANRNGVLDNNENDGSESEPPDNRDGHLDRGLCDYVTVYSRELAQSSGQTGAEELVNVNNTGAPALAALLRQAVAPDRFYSLMDRVRGGAPFRSILDFYARTGLTAEEFVLIAGQITVPITGNMAGRVNVNTAPRAVLLCLPGLEAADADALLTRRKSPDTDLSNIAWVVGALTPEKARAIGEYVTVKSYQFSGDIVAVSGDGRAFRRYRAVLDASNTPPRVLRWDDETRLGWPLAPEILTSMRAGKTPVATTVITNAGGG